MKEYNKRNSYNNENINPEDLVNLQLKLHTPPDFNTLAVFIRDPNNNKRYWHRSIEVIQGKKLGLDFIDILTLDMSDFDRIPCPEEHLKIALYHTINYRKKDEKDPEDEVMESAVGIAVYEGKNKLSLEQIIHLVGVKYHSLRKAFLTNLN